MGFNPRWVVVSLVRKALGKGVRLGEVGVTQGLFEEKEPAQRERQENRAGRRSRKQDPQRPLRSR